MSKKGMENVVLTAQNHRNAWSFTATVKYIQIALQMTHHFYLELFACADILTDCVPQFSSADWPLG